MARITTNSRNYTTLLKWVQSGKIKLDLDGVIGSESARKTRESLWMYSESELLEKATEIITKKNTSGNFLKYGGFIEPHMTNPSDRVIIYPGHLVWYVKCMVKYNTLWVDIHIRER